MMAFTAGVLVPAAPALAALAIGLRAVRSEAGIARTVVGALLLAVAAAAALAPAAPLASFVSLAVADIALIVALFSARALQGATMPYARFFGLLAAAVAASLTVAVAGDLRVIAAAWVAAGLCTTALLAADGRPAARRWARRHLAIECVGDLAWIVALIAAYRAFAGFDLGALHAPPAPAVDVFAIALVVAGAARSALVPLHRWLPNSMETPTPVSALMHAGLVNGAGVLLAKCAPAVAASTAALALALGLGAATVIVAAFFALPRAEAKRRLGWSTCAQMGFMVVQCACGAFAAALVHLALHGGYKCAAFLGVAGTLQQRARPVLRRGAAAAPAAAAVPLAALSATAGIGAALLFGGAHVASLSAAPLVLAAAWATALAAARGALERASGTAALVLALAVPPLAVAAYLLAVAAVEPWIGAAAAAPAARAAAWGVGVAVVVFALLDAAAVPLRLPPALYALALGEGRALRAPAAEAA